MSILQSVSKAVNLLPPVDGHLGRRAWLAVTYQHKNQQDKDITDDISQYFLSMSYTDNLSGQVDDISITLEDKAGLWDDAWLPEAGAILECAIHTYNWDNVHAGEEVLPLGRFEIDEIEVASAPSTVTIKGVSVTVAETSTLRSILRSKTWENVSVWKVANDIAWQNGMKLFWDCEDNPNLDKTEQTDESDLDFLQKVCDDAGFALKITLDTIIIFDEVKYEKKNPVMTLAHPATGTLVQEQIYSSKDTTGYSLKKKTRDVYKACHVKYAQEKDKAVIEATFTDPHKSTGPILEINQQVASVEEAERLARKKLREQNKEEWTGSYAREGCLVLVAGVTIWLSNFGQFDGKYIITQAKHELGSTYTTSIEIRRCIDGY